MTTLAGLPSALRHRDTVMERLRGRRPAVFLDYDGVLTPIVDRPADAVLSESMRETVRALAARWPVCVVSGRDRTTVQQLMGIDDLVVAGSHGFDIWSPRLGTITHDTVAPFVDLIAHVTEKLQAQMESISGVSVEPKYLSVAVHYRLAAPRDRERLATTVGTLVGEDPDRLRLMPGKMVYELQPNIDWNKGKAVLYLMHTLGLDSPEVVPLYLGDDITDEDALRVVRGHGIGIIVGSPDDPEVADRPTAAEFGLAATDEVQRFLDTLARLTT